MQSTRLKYVLSMVIGLTALCSVSAFAGDALVVTDAWVRAAPPGVKTHAGYLTLHNNADAHVSIVAAHSPQYEQAEIHYSRIVDGVATMTRQDQITLPPGGVLKMAPGGFHLMLMNPKVALQEGDTVEIALQMASGEALSFAATVTKTGGMSHDSHSGKKMN